MCSKKVKQQFCECDNFSVLSSEYRGYINKFCKSCNIVFDGLNFLFPSQTWLRVKQEKFAKCLLFFISDVITAYS